jgi:2-oxoisovalerate dehydrogenase E1 component
VAALDPVEEHLLAALAEPAEPAEPAELAAPAEQSERSETTCPADPRAPVRAGSSLTGEHCLRLFDAQLASRHLDITARRLRESGPGCYTIGSSGHEGNAAVAAALRPTDPVLLHYRSGAFYVTRGWQLPGHDPVWDVLLGLCASADEPIAGGRHKVFGHHDLAVLPQTSTIASHLPRAVGMAFAVERAARLGVACTWPADAVVMASFGDASINHSTFAGAVNAAGWVVESGLPLPLLLVCEDNRIGISVPSPPGWVASVLSSRPHLRSLSADGTDLAATYDATRLAVDHVRRTRRPAVLHLDMVRLSGHAGSDVESAYRSPAEVAADLARDPLLTTARQLVNAGLLTPDEVLDRYQRGRDDVLRRASEAAETPRLRGAAQVMAPLAPRHPVAVAEQSCRSGSAEVREAVFGAGLPEAAGALTLAQSINAALLDAAAAHPELLVFGQDVSRKGGVYGVTRGLRRALGAARVFDTLLDEQAILGLALGCGVSGLLPVAEIQYLAYLHNAEDQLRGEAATLSFFSQGAYRNPMVVRVAAYADPDGFGGHFHNDTGVGVLRDVPGLVVASPARPDDAAAMLRTCLAAAVTDGSVCVFLEPIALYHVKDLHTSGDRGWLSSYVGPGEWADAHVPIGAARVYGDGADLALVTFGNGLRVCLRVARRLSARGIGVRVVDLRWLAPLPVADVVAAARATRAVLVVDETRHTGGVSEGVVTGLVESGLARPVRRVTGLDSLVPLGPAARHVLLDEHTVEREAIRLHRDTLG